MKQFATPMMRQYMEIKNEYPDCLLFFRMGDFYELFLEDAHLGSRLLNITLTGKAGGKDGKIPMAGVPYHAADVYITKLVKAGYKVAICEQLSPPNKKGLVKRGVVRIVTPGTLLEIHSLDTKTNNFIVCAYLHDNGYALAVSDLSTGYFALKEETATEGYSPLLNDLAEIKPAECLLSEELYNNPDTLKLLSQQKGMNIFPLIDFPTEKTAAEKTLKKHFRVTSLAGFGIQSQTTALLPGAALITYLRDTQNSPLPHIKRITPYDVSDGLKLDRSTIANLELFATIREHDTNGSLLSVLDHTITAMGGRMLKAWIKKPLTDKEMIEERWDGVSVLSAEPTTRATLQELLKKIPDIERVFTRLSVQIGNVRDIIQLQQALLTILEMKELLTDTQSKLLGEQINQISPTLQTLIQRIATVFIENPPLSVRDGGIINEGVHEELDAVRNSIKASKLWIQELEKKEKARTGIATLKVTFNKVFGFSIEVSRANAHLVPKEYIRKQTLVSAERYITEELKKHEDVILSAEERINDIEYKMFIKFISELLLYTEAIQSAAESIATIDVLSNFSTLSEKNRYIRPKLLYSGELRIQNGRHPVVEGLLEDIPFVPNDITLDNISQSLLLITGPNMAGKSVLIRQVALIVLMAQIGCFVPASSAHISIVDRIFVRSGASDFITSGLSTFMVEMVETADILNNATSHSLIIMDEIGRGTSTYDGISIAWSVAEFLVTQHAPSPKVLFATHYHELQELENEFPGKIKNYHMAVTQEEGNPIFLHTLTEGGASHSFGVSVAKLAGVPEGVVSKAETMLQLLEERHSQKVHTQVTEKYEQVNLIEKFIIKELEAVNIGSITPLQALNFLASLKERYTLLQNDSTLSREKD